jgi:hypothetical protein
MFDINSEHTMVTNFYGSLCSKVRSPWISNCYYNLAFNTLNYTHGRLEYSYKFDQKRFFMFDQGEVESMAKYGYAYVPEACEDKDCPVHMVYHGCN